MRGCINMNLTFFETHINSAPERTGLKILIHTFQTVFKAMSCAVLLNTPIFMYPYSGCHIDSDFGVNKCIHRKGQYL